MKTKPSKKEIQAFREQERLRKASKKADRRRWYLHSVMKGSVKIRPKLRIIYYEQCQFDSWTYKQIKAFAELQVKFRYSAQQTLTI